MILAINGRALPSAMGLSAMISHSQRSAKNSQERAPELAQFIRDELESIIGEWEQFAASIQPTGDKMQKDELRDHARHVLEEIAQDLETFQTACEQLEKSRDMVPERTTESGAKIHGLLRLTEGFGITGVVGEFRALRASVIRLWGEKNPDARMDQGDLVRFNEAIDQGIIETVDSFSTEKERQTRFFETIISSSPDHGYILDRDCRFIYANQPMLDVLQLSLDELSGRTVSDVA